MEELDEKLLVSFNEQFATNQNHGQDIFIQFLSAILVVLIGYGYIYANTAQSADIWTVAHDDPKSLKDITSYALIDLFGAFIVSELILTLLATVVLNIGYSFRRDQLVIYKLRKKALGKRYQDTFGSASFDPRGQNLWDFLPEFNRMFFFGICVLQIFLLTSFFVALGRAYCWPGTAFASICLYITSIFPVGWTFWLYNNYYKKYYWVMSDSTKFWWRVSLAERTKKL